MQLPLAVGATVSRLALAIAVTVIPGLVAVAQDRPNILLITVDDMSADSVGVFGCKLAGTTPNVDALAADSLRFEHAHVQVGNCMPSRNVMFSSLYPHNSGVEGFYQVPDAEFPTLADLFQSAGYLTAIRGKVAHSTPYKPYPGWDLVLDDVIENPHPKRIGSYYEATAAGIEASRAAGKPFCLVINVSDPHKPFYNPEREPESHTPSRTYTSAEVPVPGFLPDDPVVREELAEYYTTVRRADDCVGATLKALDDSGMTDQTLVMFLSDHGMPLPFAKTAVYHHSSHTPLIIRWPGVTRAGSIDSHHVVSAIDFLPTLLEAAGIPRQEHFEGRSFAQLLHGQPQEGRDFVIKEYTENAGRNRQPMRAIQDRRFLYIFNPWSDGQRQVRTATMGTKTYRRMQQLAPQDPAVAARLELFDHRVVEEFYDIENDPDALHNLIDDPTHQADVARLRSELEKWMVDSGDFALSALRHRHDRAYLARFMEDQEKISAQRATSNRSGATAEVQKRSDLIKVHAPDKVVPGEIATLRVEFALPKSLGSQKLHVTLKGGSPARRIERQVVEIQGEGTRAIEFRIPQPVADGTIQFAAFVGADYARHLQHLSTRPQQVERAAGASKTSAQ